MFWPLNILFAVCLTTLIVLEFSPSAKALFQPENLLIKLKGDHDDKTLEAFLEQGIGGPGNDAGSVVRKWNNDVLVHVHGALASEDRQYLAALMNDIDGVIASRRIAFSQDMSSANINIHVIPRDQFTDVLPGTSEIENNQATSYWLKWNADSEIHDATILIDGNLGGTRLRNQLVRLIVSSLGINQSSPDDRASIFTSVFNTRLSAQDENMLRLLYDPALECGTTRDEFIRMLDGAGRSASQEEAG